VTLSVSTQYAIRSLTRHGRRTFLSILGTGVGVAVCLFMIAFVRGEGKMMMKAAAESGVGHLRVVPAEWQEQRDNGLRIETWRRTLAWLRADPAIAVATPRIRKDALLGFGTRVTGVELHGVDPATEQASNRLVRNVAEGRYLEPDDTGVIVVGRTLADRLDVELDDALMLTVTDGNGDMNSTMARIAGIVETGSRDLDAGICHLPFADAERLIGRVGAGELTILIRIPQQLELVRAHVTAAVPRTAAVLTWREIMPELYAGTKVDEVWTRLTVGIIICVVFLGIASAQLTAVLERRREFAVLAALGMKNHRLVGIMLVEGLVLGVFGAVAGLALGLPAAYYTATRGIDFGKIYGDIELTMSNVLMDPVFRGEFGWWLVPLAFGLSLAATMLSSLYPAWFATRTDPAAALRVEG